MYYRVLVVESWQTQSPSCCWLPTNDTPAMQMTGLAFEVLSLNSLLSSLSLFLSLSLSPSVLFIYFCQFYVLQLLQIRENWCIPEVSFFLIGKRGTRRGSKTKTDSCIATKSLSFPSFFCQTLELYHHFSVHQISWQKLGSLKPGVCHR